ncbi:MAG: hypothetical protein IJ597_05970, partial [Synergistaceae bacterium]|nr:hypothetical protein [Synergistaceae bacterium]
QIIRDLIYEFEEYNMGYIFTDKNPLELVQSYNYENVISTIWGVDEAHAIATTASNFNITTSSNNALAYVVNVADASNGAVTPPITYLCSFTTSELKTIFGTRYDSVFAAKTSAASENALDAATTAKIFEVLKVEFQTSDGVSIPVLGSESSVNITDAVNKGALEISDNGQGIDIKLNLMLANLEANDSNKLELTESSNADLKGAIIVPDGVNDDKISGSIIFPQKEITTSQENNTNENETTETKTPTQSQTATSDNQGSGSGGSCNLMRNNAGAPLAELEIRSVLLFFVIFAFAFLKIRRG